MSARPSPLAHSLEDSCGEGRECIFPDTRSQRRIEGWQHFNERRILSLSSTLDESVTASSLLNRRFSPRSKSLMCILSLLVHTAEAHCLSWTLLRAVSRLVNVLLIIVHSCSQDLSDNASFVRNACVLLRQRWHESQRSALGVPSSLHHAVAALEKKKNNGVTCFVPSANHSVHMKTENRVI